MITSDRDEINFNKFLKSVRKSQKASLVKTTYGVCSKSEMSKVEKGTRLPEKIVRDRLTARLGISGEEYEEYLTSKEYKQWQARMEIIRCINREDVKTGEEKVAEYEKMYSHHNAVQKQFVATMRYMLYEIGHRSVAERFEQISLAVHYTVPDIDAAFAGCQLLADQELNLIMEYVEMCSKAPEGETLADWKMRVYKQVDNYVVKSYMDKIAQSKVYSKLACHVCDLVFNDLRDEDSMRYALDLCNRAIEVLRDTVRLYYFVEINEFRIRLMEKLNIENLEENEEYQDSVALTEVFHELYEESELQTYMKNFTHLYTETECNDVAEVVRIRRKMMGLSMYSLGEISSSERTVFRIEKKEGDPHIETMREVLDAVGLCAEFKRARVVSSDAEAMRLSEVLYKQINSGENEKALETHKRLLELLDLDITFNHQEMLRTEAIILRKMNKIKDEEYHQLLKDIMGITIGFEKLRDVDEKYLSRVETYCMHNLAATTQGDDVELCKKFLEAECEKIMQKDELESSKFCMYEMFMYRCANYLGNRGDYGKSAEISKKLLKESLRNRRSLYLANCDYNELWTNEKYTEENGKSFDASFVYKILKRDLLLSKLARKADWEKFFQQKLDLYLE